MPTFAQPSFSEAFEIYLNVAPSLGMFRLLLEELKASSIFESRWEEERCSTTAENPK